MTEPILLWCNDCESHKSEDEFHANKRRKTGRDVYCKPCTAVRSSNHYLKNKEKRSAQYKAWLAANPGKASEYCEKWRQKFPEKSKQSRANFYAANRETELAKDKARREANIEAFRIKERESYARNKKQRQEKMKRWAAENKDLIAKYAADRRAARNKRTPLWLTDEQHAAIIACYSAAQMASEATGVLYHVDHIVPLRGKIVSGLHVPWNLQVIIATANLKKNNIQWPDMP